MEENEWEILKNGSHYFIKHNCINCKLRSTIYYVSPSWKNRSILNFIPDYVLFQGMLLKGNS